MTISFSQLPESPFARLRQLLGDKPPGQPEISLAVGDPRHPAPQAVLDVIAANLDSFGRYPPIPGLPEWQTAARDWLQRRFGMDKAAYAAPHQLLPVSGTREGLFLMAQLARPNRPTKNLMAMPNPFYQVYAAAAIAAGATPVYLNATADNGLLPDPEQLSPAELDAMRAVFCCSPTNPQGAVADSDYLEKWLGLAARHDFLLVMDECYADIYDRALEDTPPVSAAAIAARRPEGLQNLVVFHSLSKRSSLPGLRSGLCVGGDAIMKDLLDLRMIAGPQTPLAAQKAAALAWSDDAHVAENRTRYQNKLDIAESLLGGRFGFYRPAGGFFLWLNIGTHTSDKNSDEDAARLLWEKGGVRVLPGSYLGREVKGINPGTGYIRVALVAEEAETELALTRMRDILSAEGYT